MCVPGCVHRTTVGTRDDLETYMHCASTRVGVRVFWPKNKQPTLTAFRICSTRICLIKIREKTFPRKKVLLCLVLCGRRRCSGSVRRKRARAKRQPSALTARTRRRVYRVCLTGFPCMMERRPTARSSINGEAGLLTIGPVAHLRVNPPPRLTSASSGGQQTW
jgi:hypothetical protein